MRLCYCSAGVAAATLAFVSSCLVVLVLQTSRNNVIAALCLNVSGSLPCTDVTKETKMAFFKRTVGGNVRGGTFKF